ncbi:transcription termination factor, mitochondrial [Trichoplusia ni]|uniref:Transcription termination factor, mitochondrial n=1 Tax=Trichoplusia ni TaxID=7111 RepID=A0A7E5WBJ6_TRINI|nr:transcription termination factor, mitochondrial [Trichoplusia ni]
MALRSVISVFRPLTTFYKTNAVTILKCVSPKLNYVGFIQNNVRLSTVSHRNRTKVPVKSGFDESKAKIVLALNFQSPEDTLPFYKLPIRTLIHIYKVTKDDESKGYCKNRLYYIASRIQVPPSVLSEKIAKRTFIYSLTFDWLEKSLDVLLDMGVTSDRILRDLWVLKYHHETIHERLLRVKNMGISNLYPWMVRCSEDILQRFISISQETKTILGESKSTQTYLANRLNTSVDHVEEMCIKIPALKTIRVTKVKHFLDFLLMEGFEVEDIAMKPRVLSASQKTVKQRLDKLRGLGLNEINLNVLCRSKKDFQKYCESIETISKESGNPS